MRSAVYEFLFPGEVYIVDPAPWPPLLMKFGASSIALHKPIGDFQAHQPLGALNVGPAEAHSTVLRLECAAEAQPEIHELYPLAHGATIWLRVLTRQYWVGFGGSGNVYARGGRLTTDPSTGERQSTGWGTAGAPVILKPLSIETWAKVGGALAFGQAPRASDLIFCSGMLALSGGSLQESVALMGIACEIELNSCIESLLSSHGDKVARKLYDSRRLAFQWKLEHLAPLISGRNFSTEEPHWHAHVLRLYERRGTAAHRESARSELSEAPFFTLATDAFLRWTHSVRTSRGELLGPCPLAVSAALAPQG